jgi:hypothetical protein
MITHSAFVSLVALMFVLQLSTAPAVASAHTLEVVSLTSTGGLPNYDAFTSSISGDGRYVAFGSWAWNMFPGDMNDPYGRIYLRDRVTKQTTRVSVGTNGVPTDGFSDGV